MGMQTSCCSAWVEATPPNLSASIQRSSMPPNRLWLDFVAVGGGGATMCDGEYWNTIGVTNSVEGRSVDRTLS